ncbi:hypothetical protein ZWY2020_025483 [Hordeum vulgare]|nr:hypothetical protein ZWY2020_025483 [Hordeum vulgare]
MRGRGHDRPPRHARPPVSRDVESFEGEKHNKVDGIRDLAAPYSKRKPMDADNTPLLVAAGRHRSFNPLAQL